MGLFDKESDKNETFHYLKNTEVGGAALHMDVLCNHIHKLLFCLNI
jgi:hypothetical protein